MGIRIVRMVAVYVGLAGLAFVMANPAAAGPAPSWQTSGILGATPGSVTEVDSVVANSPSDAWAGGARDYYPMIQHWNGTTWTDVTPAGSAFRTFQGRANVIGSSSPANTWALVSHAKNGYAMRWNGKDWTKFSFGQYLMWTGIAVFSPTNVWAFANNGHYTPFARHYNGKTWRSVAMPGLPFAASALSPKNIWAAGPSTTTYSTNPSGPYRDLLMNWNGKAWTSVKLPGLGMTQAEHFAPVAVLAISSTSVWVTGDIRKVVNDLSVRPELLHWDGRAWQAYAPPGSLGAIASDGTGGLWIVEYNLLTTSTAFAHYSAGQWQVVPSPLPASPAPGTSAFVQDIAQVPGTSSLWAAGVLFDPYTEGVIYRYGP